VLTLGIDLASQASRTAVCWIEWSEQRAVVQEPVLGAGDDDLLRLIPSAAKVGIDCPFGWPDAFAAAVSAHGSFEPWPDAELVDLRYRHTDRVVTEIARRPLSVSSDLIGVTAMRCARLLSELDRRGDPVDRSGTGKVAEVYPAAALVVWGFEPAGYKRVGGLHKRKTLIASLKDATRDWLEMSERAVELCEKSDDCLDALVASLVARATAVGLTLLPPRDRLDQVQREGWIHLPSPGSLERLSRA
jgi:predicted nuclease with RNAse H fold